MSSSAAAIIMMTGTITVAVVANKHNLSRNDAESWISSVRYSADGMIPKMKIQEMIVTLQAAGSITKSIEVELIYAKDVAVLSRCVFDHH
jgi:hypothetical protein